MTAPRVAMIFTGGTIAMRDDAGRGNRPVLDGGALLAAVPGLDAIAAVEPIEWGLVPASHLTFDQVLAVGHLLADALARPDIDGAIVVQGTDVIEETAFAWDLLPMAAKPVVVTGAMRSASDADADGPANLLDAVRVAATPALGGHGVTTVMAGEIHAADDVRKVHTHATDTFRSPNHGRVGRVTAAGVVVERQRPPAKLPKIPGRAALPVEILGFALDMDHGRLAALEASSPAGVVVAAAGGGNTPPALLGLARRLLDQDVPVALTTRCPSGQPLPGYGFEGGSTQWWEAGVPFSGTLGPLKTRVLLALAGGARLSLDDMSALMAPYGGGRLTAG